MGIWIRLLNADPDPPGGEMIADPDRNGWMQGFKIVFDRTGCGRQPGAEPAQSQAQHEERGQSASPTATGI